MEPIALEALHVAAQAISKMRGVKQATADNDSHGGEIIFTTTEGDYTLRLEGPE